MISGTYGETRCAQGGEPVAATFIFSFAEVFGGFENMTGGVADTLLALVCSSDRELC
jgi:hypothetical protein